MATKTCEACGGEFVEVTLDGDGVELLVARLPPERHGDGDRVLHVVVLPGRDRAAVEERDLCAGAVGRTGMGAVVGHRGSVRPGSDIQSVR